MRSGYVFQELLILHQYSELGNVSKYRFQISAHDTISEKNMVTYNIQWTDERNRLEVHRLSSGCTTNIANENNAKYNNMDCVDFYKFVTKNTDIIKNLKPVKNIRFFKDKRPHKLTKIPLF